MKKFKLLSIDGGGIRGIIPAVIIKELESEINKLTGENKHISDYFDMFAGTSTGAILTTLYLSPQKYSTAEAIEFYREYGRLIFNQPNIFKRVINVNGIFFPRYDTRGFEKVLDEKFGELKISGLSKPCILTSYNIRERYAHFFTQHDALKNNEYDYYIKDVIKGATAAPTYFKPAMISPVNGTRHYPLVDGGLYANNPSLCGYSEIYEEFKKEPDEMVIVSIGTGRSYDRIKYKQAKNWGLAGWINPMFDIILNTGPDVADYQLNTIFKAIGAPHGYIRLNPPLPKDDKEMILIDNVSDKNIENLIDFSVRECQRMKNEIKNAAKSIAEHI